MKKGYTIIFILLIFILFGLGCVSAKDNATQDNVTGESDDVVCHEDYLKVNQVDENLSFETEQEDNQSGDVLGVDEESSEDILGDPEEDVIVPAGTLEDFALFLQYMQLDQNSDEGKAMRQMLMDKYGVYIQPYHSNTLRLSGPITPKESGDFIMTISMHNRIINIDGDFNTLDLGGGKYQRYFKVLTGNVNFRRITIKNGYYVDNDDYMWGGAIQFKGYSYASISHCRFENCKTEGCGGAIGDGTDNTLIIENSEFIGNVAREWGGAVFCNNNAIIRNCTFDSNFAGTEHGGGGGAVATAYLTIDGCSFSYNSVAYATGHDVRYTGGAILTDYLTLSGNPSYFIDNYAQYGGAIYTDYIYKCENGVFKDNQAIANGGAIYLTVSGDVEFISCVFAGNTASGNGGAVCSNSDSCAMTFKNCIMSGNTAKSANNAWTSKDIILVQNWYGASNPSSSGDFYSKSGVVHEDTDYCIPTFDYEQDYKYVYMHLRFRTATYKEIENRLLIRSGNIIAKDPVEKAEIYDIKGEFPEILMIILPKEAGTINTFSIYAYDIYMGTPTIVAKSFDAHMNLVVDDIIYGDEDPFIEIYLDNNVNCTVHCQWQDNFESNHAFDVDISNGYGNYFLREIGESNIGSNNIKAIFDGYYRMQGDECTKIFEVKRKTVGNDSIEFTTLSNLIRKAREGNLTLDYNVEYSPENDVKYTDGVVVLWDNFVIDGRGHKMDGKSLAKILDIQGINVTVKNISFFSANSTCNGAVMSIGDGGTVKNCNITKSNGSSGIIYFNNNGTLKNCIISQNNVTKDGIVYFRGNGWVRDTEMMDNKVSNYGTILFYCLGDIRNCAIHDNEANEGGAIFFWEDGHVDNCTFKDNAASTLGGAIYFKGGNLLVNNSNFTGNKAQQGSAVYSYYNTTFANSFFDKNKATMNKMKMSCENHEVVVRFTGGDTYINAISDTNTIRFYNVTYWNGGMVNSDDEYPKANSYRGLNITFDVNDHGSIVYHETMQTDINGKASINPTTLESGKSYWFVATHNEDDYYTFIQVAAGYDVDRHTGSSVNINITDNAEFYYPDIPQNISFTIKNRTEVRVVILDPKGNEFLNETFDSQSKIDAVPLEGYDLNSNGHYNITVYNLGSMTVSPSMDSKLFRILKANSTISITSPKEEDIEYEPKIHIAYEGNNLTQILITVCDSEGRTLFTESTSNHTEYTLGGLAVGEYIIKVTNSGNYTVSLSQDFIRIKIRPHGIDANVTAENATYGQPVSFKIRTNMSGNYILNVNGTERHIKINENIQAELNWTGLDAGQYNAVLYAENSNYTVVGQYNITFNVLPYRISGTITSNSDSYTYLDTVNITVSGEIAGRYILDFNGRMETVEVSPESDGHITFKDLDSGTYNVRAYLNPNYVCDFTANQFTVNPKRVNDYMILDNATYLGRLVVEIHSDMRSAYYDVEVNGTRKNILLYEGYAQTEFNLAPGTYLIIVDCENRNYDSSIENTTFTIQNRTNYVTVTAANATYPEGAVINMTADMDGEYIIQIYECREDSYVHAFNLTVAVTNATGSTTAYLGVGTYLATALFDNQYYRTAVTDSHFNVSKGTLNFTAQTSDVSYGEDTIINVECNVDGLYIITVEDSIYPIFVSHGKGQLTLSLDIGTYSMDLMRHNPNYDYNVKTDSFKVLKRTSAIDANDKSYIINYAGKYAVTLKDSNGNALSDRKVTFTLNGADIGSAVTDSKGVATIDLTSKILKAAKAGIKNLIIRFAGDDTYSAITKTLKITINKEKTKIVAKKKTFKKSKKVKKYTIKLKDSKGKAIKKVKVTLKIKGKTYKAKTNKKGKAVFKIKNLKKKGTFKATIKFKANNYYKKATKKVKIKVK